MLTLQNMGSTAFSVLNNGALQLRVSDANAMTVLNASGNQYFNVDTRPVSCKSEASVQTEPALYWYLTLKIPTAIQPVRKGQCTITVERQL